jgi:hypothetical protein
VVGLSRLPRPGRQQPRPWALHKRSIKTQEIRCFAIFSLAHPSSAADQGQNLCVDATKCCIYVQTC